MTKVFVYGTLRKGHRNHRLLISARFIGPAFTKDAEFAMLTAGGSFPVVVREGSDRIAGEVYKVSDNELRELDFLEGYRGPGKRNMYDRETVEVLCSSPHGMIALPVQMYVGSNITGITKFHKRNAAGHLEWPEPQSP